MLLAPRQQPADRPAFPEHAAAEPSLWGLDHRALHDRYWATKGIQAVRLGEGGVDRTGPRLYLLLDRAGMALFELGPALKRLNWLKPRALRLRIAHRGERGYAELVEADGEDRLVAIRRVYRPDCRAATRAWLTADASLAAAWAAASTRGEGMALIKSGARRGRIASHVCDGPLPDAPDGSFVRAILERWDAPGSSLDGVYQSQPGVWIHESARVSPDAKLIPPLWIGAGVEINDAEPLVGPLVIADAPAAAAPPGPINWDTLPFLNAPVLPRWRMPGWRAAAKRAFDIVFSLAVLLCMLPLFPFIALAIMVEDGRPIFFAHRRQTLGGREFPCWKFRTMCRNAEQIKTQLVSANVCDGPQFFIKNDPRLLRVGKLLRKLQIDELPQFWNVLLGHMSVVGPRPSPDKENQYCPAWREARLSVRPGITGLWQVKRTREPQTDFQEWIRYDLEYVQHQSLRLDLWIVIQTVIRIVKG